MSLERRFTDETADALGRLGHDVNWWRDWEWKSRLWSARVVKNHETGMLEGGADVRRPGGPCAAGNRDSTLSPAGVIILVIIKGGSPGR